MESAVKVTLLFYHGLCRCHRPQRRHSIPAQSGRLLQEPTKSQDAPTKVCQCSILVSFLLYNSLTMQLTMLQSWFFWFPSVCFSVFFLYAFLSTFLYFVHCHTTIQTLYDSITRSCCIVLYRAGGNSYSSNSIVLSSRSVVTSIPQPQIRNRPVASHTVLNSVIARELLLLRLVSR